MRAVIQRARGASVTINGHVNAQFDGLGLVVLLGIEESDSIEDVEWLVKKICNLRIFDDEAGVMNLSVREQAPCNPPEGDVVMRGEGEHCNIIVVSQFTLFASYKKGNRPSWLRAAGHAHAVPLYEAFLQRISAEMGKPVGHGEFGAEMQVKLTNDGPVTIVMDTKARE